jgi:peptidoglycan/LPS O-acetylase OafA/YrhL
VWPLLVYWLGRRRLAWLCAALVAGCLALRAALFAAGTAWVAIYVMTITRLDDLAVGGAIACLARGPRGLAPLLPAARVIGIACLASVIVAMVLRGAFELSDDWTVTLGFSVASLGFGSVLVGALSARRGGLVDRLLSCAPLRTLGKYSYCIYVVHLPIVVSLAVPPGFGHLALFGYTAMPSTAAYFVHLAVAIALSLTVAFASWYLLELPFLRLKRRFADPAPSPGGA